MTQPSAKIIADSISEWGQRLTTMEVVMHRFILAEFNTHRVFSRNSASSRAIPYQKMRERVANDPAYPVFWGSEKKGMAPGDELVIPEINMCRSNWVMARDKALFEADQLYMNGLHKSLINRLIEPFMWHTAIVTATEWDNFFHQRCHPAAMPEIQALANAMQVAYYTSVPKEVPYGGWHMPYLRLEDHDDVIKFLGDTDIPPSPLMITNLLKRVSTARCARVSYLTQDGHRSISTDLDLYDRLFGSGHWSPFEHVATPIHDGSERPDVGNFRGWGQFRKEFKSENCSHFVPNLPELAQIAIKEKTNE